jgi:hypothetical protein
MPLSKRDPQKWQLYDGHNRKAVNRTPAIRVLDGPENSVSHIHVRDDFISFLFGLVVVDWWS